MAWWILQGALPAGYSFEAEWHEVRRLGKLKVQLNQNDVDLAKKVVKIGWRIRRGTTEKVV